MTSPTTHPLQSRLEGTEAVESDESGQSYDLSSNLQDNPQVTAQTLLSILSSDEHNNESVRHSTSDSDDHLYVELHRRGSIVIQPNSNVDCTTAIGSGEQIYDQPTSPTSSAKVVTPPPVTDTVVYDDIEKLQNPQVS